MSASSPSSTPAPSSARADRFASILEGAARVFAARSYRRTQMADIARELGVSPGTLYLYVESKEALFHLLIERGFGRDARTPLPEGPVRTPAPGATLDLLRRRLENELRLPKLDAALARDRRGDARAELESIVRELYELVERNRVGITLLERSAHDWPELAALFYVGMRRDLLARLERYLAARIARGALAPVPDAAAAARFINESVAWFAMHRHGDVDSKNLEDDAVRETVVMLVVRALAKERR